MKKLEDMTDTELDVLYFQTFGRLAWHMSREGYIHFLYQKQ